MKYKAIFLLCTICSIHTLSHSMKRRAEETLGTTRSTKKAKTKPLHLHNIFKIHAQLEQNAQKTYRNQPAELQKVMNLITSMPKEIKATIATHLISKDTSEWWYFNKKITHSDQIIYALSFHPHDKSLAIGIDKHINILNPKTNELIRSYSTPKYIYSLAYSENGNSLAYGLCNGDVEVRTSDLEKNLFFYNAEMPIWSIALSPDEKKIAIGSDQITEHHNLQLIDLESNQSIASIPHDGRNIYGMYFENDNITLKYTLSPDRIATYNTESHIRSSTKLPVRQYVWSLSCDKNNICALGMNNFNAYIINASSHEKLASFKTLAHIYSIALRNNTLAVGLQKGNILFFKHYRKPTPQQQLLREILFLWTQLEKPNKNITSPSNLLASLSHTLRLQESEVTTTWNTLPEPVRDCLWNTLYRIIKTYGKNVKKKKKKDVTFA